MFGSQEPDESLKGPITTMKALEKRMELVRGTPLYRQYLGRAFIVAMGSGMVLTFGLPFLAIMLLGSNGYRLAPGLFLAILYMAPLVPYLTHRLVEEPVVKELLRAYLASRVELSGYLAMVGSVLAYAGLTAYRLHDGDFEYALWFMGFIWISFIFPTFNYFFYRAAFIELKPLGKLFKGFVKPSLAGILLSILLLPLAHPPHLLLFCMVAFLSIGLPHLYQAIKFRRYHLMLLPGTGR